MLLSTQNPPTDRESTKRVTVVGIDGAGKGEILAALREGPQATQRRLTTLSCPLFHETSDAPFGSLSRALARLSRAGDVLGEYELKAIAMYLQMTLYGPVEKCFIGTFEPTIFVCERHPLVESLVYGPLYLALGRGNWNRNGLDGRIARALGEHAEADLRMIRSWHAAETRRLGLDADVWDWLDDAAAQMSGPTTEIVETLRLRYRTDLPDIVVWIDISADEAARRCRLRSRGETLELHENPAFLRELREGYLRVRQEFADHFPDVAFHTVGTGRGLSAADTAGLVVDAAATLG